MTTKVEYKIIADHLRSSSFLIADGILPSNEGRGYVLRRIMRRAMLQLFKLGTQKPSMFKFVDALIQEMGQAYPSLTKAKDLIVETLKIEEEKFRSTLKNGLKIIEEEIAAMKASKNYVENVIEKNPKLKGDFSNFAKKIIVLEKGEIIEEGNHSELTSLKGAYYKLVKNQLELGS